MPSPQFHQWAKEKPTTTNQTYGFYLREIMKAKEEAEWLERRKQHNQGITNNRLSRSVTLPSINMSRKAGPKNRFNINAGYTMGPTSVRDRAGYCHQNSGTINLRLGSAPKSRNNVDPDLLNGELGLRNQSAPQGRGKARDNMYLWHSLSGCLVHVQQKKQ